jgi:type IV conjugative transfer system protein TraL
MDKYYIPQHLDKPFRLFIWTWDEVAAFSLPCVTLFFFLNAPMTGVLLGMVSFILLKKLKGEEGHYFLAHLAYWYLPPFVMYKSTPHSYIREIVG